MCGIAGILSCSDWSETHSSALQTLQRSLHHRGPDDQGIWVDPSNKVGLVHTRLSILDLSSAGHQPMPSQDGRFVITFNGEIYNFKELRAELEASGVGFQSNSDTEVLLNLYQREGGRMLKRLRGMFAFCIWDNQQQTAFLARDPLGIKPLYYSTQSGSLIFASELRSLRACPLIPSSINGTAVTCYLETGSVPEPLTLLSSVHCLQAGHSLTWQSGATTLERYWELDFSPANNRSYSDATTRNALEDTLRAHLVSDVPVGIFLSGGIDSTAIAALAQATGLRHFSTFSIGVDDARLDESSLARRTAAHFQSQHHERQLDARSAKELFVQFLNCIDQPTIDGFNTFTVSDFAKKEGFKVVLSGLGGDEIFGGYPSFQKVPSLARWGRWAHKLGPLATGSGHLLEKHGRSAKMRRLGGFLTSQPNLQNAYRAFRSVFSPAEAKHIAASYGLEINAPESPQEVTSAIDPTDGDHVSRLEISRYMRNQLLKDSDVMSMAHGLELRVPFVDRVLVDYLAGIPSEVRLQPGKNFLLKAVPEIPEWIRQQPKRGFAFPFQKWLREDWNSAFEQSSRRIPFAKPTWYQLWAVFMLDHWLEQSSFSA